MNRIWCLPPFHLRELFKIIEKEYPNIVVVEQQSNWDWKIGGENLHSLDVMSSKYIREYPRILEEITNLQPLFARHYDSMPFIELATRDLALIVVRIADQIFRDKVKAVFFGFQSSHHIYSQMLEIAARLNRIPQVFEIPIPGLDCVVPFLQYEGVSDRTPFSGSFQPFLSIEEIESWSKNPNIPITDNVKTSKNFLGVALWLCLFRFRFAAARLWKQSSRYRTRTQKPLLELPNVLNQLKILFNQKKALVYYEDQALLQSKELESLLQLKFDNHTQVPIVIFAQFQPEASSFPEGGKLHNFIDLVVELRNRGLKNPILYKEHPASFIFRTGYRLSQVGTSRSVDYYRNLRALGCVFISKNASLNFNKCFVVTLTGSVAVERSLAGYSTCVLGNPWYKGLPGSLNLDDLSQFMVSGSSNPKISESAREFLCRIPQGRNYYVEDSNWSATSEQRNRKGIESMKDFLYTLSKSKL
jgi:hypothetical protein